MNKPKVIAFYLPQYHPTPDNDKWWGKGFTEWTNVGKAKPLFPGHYQPKVPTDLGYYDLRLEEAREAQAELAKEAGIYGFCYYHYWFGNGKEELELPFNEVLRLGKPDFPFMLCWANESWHKKFWNKDGKGTSRQVLVEQTYPGQQDIIDHFYRLLPAFKDSRYIKIDDKPAFMIYKYEDYKDIENFIKTWNQLAVKEGLKGITFIANIWSSFTESELQSIKKIGFEKVNHLGLWSAFYNNYSFLNRCQNFVKKIFNVPNIKDFRAISKRMFGSIDSNVDVYPTVLPNWDHTPRSGRKGTLLKNATPENFGAQLDLAFDITKDKKDNFIFLKSWNEWGEGNYMEPDLKFGKEYINILKSKIENLK